MVPTETNQAGVRSLQPATDTFQQVQRDTHAARSAGWEPYQQLCYKSKPSQGGLGRRLAGAACSPPSPHHKPACRRSSPLRFQATAMSRRTNVLVGPPPNHSSPRTLRPWYAGALGLTLLQLAVQAQ